VHRCVCVCVCVYAWLCNQACMYRCVSVCVRAEWRMRVVAYGMCISLLEHIWAGDVLRCAKSIYFRNRTLDCVCVVGFCEAMGHGKEFYYFLETILVSQFGRWVGSKRGYPQRLQNRIEIQPVADALSLSLGLSTGWPRNLNPQTMPQMTSALRELRH